MSDWRAGQTAVVTRVPAAEPVVGELRARHDPSAAQGMPAHITLLFPWLPAERARAERSRLGAICADVLPLQVRFARCGRFDGGVLWLDPEPSAPLRDLTLAIAGEWPDAPPFEGRHPDVVPHLTVTNGASGAEIAGAEAALSPRLPLVAEAGPAEVWSFDGRRWRPLAV